MSSFSVPRNVPTFGNPQRLAEDRLWSASGMTARGSRGSAGVLDNVSHRVDDFLASKGQLPMYKDKPYTYAASRRMRPYWRRKRSILLFLLLAVSGLWYFGYLSRDNDSELGNSSWSWLSSPEPAGKKVDWPKRRERVVEAFELSWDSYERYAWGSYSHAVSCRIARVKLLSVLTYALSQATTSTIPLRKRANTWHPRVSGGSSSIPSTP